MIEASKLIVFATVSLLGSSLIALAQTPAGGADAGLGADTTRAERIEQSRDRQQGVTTGSAMERREVERRDATPMAPTNAPIPNAAISQPSAVEAAPAGR